MRYGRRMNIAQAKQIPLGAALERLGFTPSRTSGHDAWYSSPFREESEPSFKINLARNVWYDFGQGEGGDLIDFVKQLYRLDSVSEALAQLDELEGALPPPTRARSTPSNDNQADAPALTIVEDVPLRSRSLIAYLKERGIPVEIAKQHVRELHYRNRDKGYFAIGIGNDSGGFEIRNRYFKGTIGSKDLSTIPGSRDRVFVFEGMVDFLTARAMLGDQLDGTVIVLNSVAMKDKAIDIIKELNPLTVELYRDNDTSGQALLTAFQQALAEPTIVDWAKLYAGYGDLNEWYVQNRQEKPTPRARR